MRHMTFATLVVAASSLIASADVTTKPAAEGVRLGPLPALDLLARPATAPVSGKRIKALIADLAAMDKPDFGLSATLSGSGFAPLPGQGQAGAMVLTNHGLATSPALAELVKLGPDALPALLDALDDSTPTKVVVGQDGFGFGGLWFSNELPTNPANPAERAAGPHGGGRPGQGDTPRTYTVRVGDVCFVAVGQIVGRPYQAVRYQPTAIIVINSTVRDPKLCADVRSLWHSADPRRMLFDSLRADYATVDGPGDRTGPAADDFECAAALRMLYYFPRETETLIAARLGRLDVSDAMTDQYEREHQVNGVRAQDFIKAVAWSPLPLVRGALTDVFRRAGNFNSELAAVPGVEGGALVRRRLEPVLKARMSPDNAMYDDGRAILTAVLQRSPDAARWAFEPYLTGPSAQGRVTASDMLAGTDASWATELLHPLLTDTRPAKWQQYEPLPGQHDRQLPVRVCDSAAATLSSIHPNLKFTLEGDYDNLDRQIATMRAALERR